MAKRKKRQNLCTLNWEGKETCLDCLEEPLQYEFIPCPEESVNFDTTENLFFECDNLDALKYLQTTHLNKVKCIYIDPPYNTGKSRQYKDDFGDITGCKHSDWLNMMYPRLYLARDLLRDDGVIFISIDDNEVHNLRKICDEIFGEENFVAQIIWERAYSPINLKKHFSESHDYILCYAKSVGNLVCNGLPRSNEANDRYSNPDDDLRGVWKSTDCTVGPVVKEKVYEITLPSGRKVLPPNARCWLYTKQRFEEMVADNRISFGDGNGIPRVKKFLSEVKQTMTPMTLWKYTEIGHSQDAMRALKEVFDGKTYFDYPKSTELIKRMLQLYTRENDIILDFFSGSGTTAHAVMQLNAEDGGNRKWIMVQLPELCDEKSEAYKAGYKNICEIGKERIRRAGKKVLQEAKHKDIDVGFQVWKVRKKEVTNE
jgi:adenine-specific DNA-methyltransferase